MKENTHKFRTWVKTHKKQLICAGIGITGLVGTGIAGTRNKGPVKYSMAWIKGLSDSQWEIERQIVQDKYLDQRYDIPFRVDCKRILDLFDRVKSDRDWAGKIPRGPAYHREHAGIYKPD